MANLEHAEDDKEGVKMSSEITAACPQVPPVGLQGNPVMHAGVLPCAVPSFADASKLLSAPYSCLVMHTHRKHVALPPMYLKKKRTGIEEELGSELLKFSQSFNGVPLAYDNVRIVGPHGDIHDDSGYIHMDIEANFILFRPQRGQKLVGKVNKLGESHVGCLVHSCFNASILKPRPVPLQTWLDFGPKIGDELEFDVTALDADTAGVLLIRGKLHSTRVQELMALGESSQSNADQAEPESEPESEQTTVKAHDSTDNTLKKEFKEEDSEVVIASSQDENTVPELNGTDETNGNDLSGKKKKKKKKKEKEVKAEPKDDSPSNSSGYRSDKPSKKRKHDISMDLNEVDDPPKSKKKKKKHDV